MTEPQKTAKASKRKATGASAQHKTETETKKDEEITLDSLKRDYPILNDLPELTPSNQLTPKQAGELAITHDLVRDAWDRIASKFDDTDPKSKLDATYLFAYVNEKADAFFATIAVDDDAYRKWSLGRLPGDLALAYVALLSFYQIELGKSASSAQSTSGTQSN